MPELLKKGGIYQIRNTVNGKIYVGSASRFLNRWRLHKRSLQQGYHHSRFLQRAWDKCGEAAFVFEPLITCASSMLLSYEQQFMDKWKPEYNVCPTAGSSLGVIRSEGTKLKISKSKQGTTHRPDVKEAIGLAAKAMWRNTGIRARIIEKQTGTKRSEETKKLLSDNKKLHYQIDANREISRQISRTRKDLMRYEYNGVTHTITEWSEITGLSMWAIRQRLDAGWTIDKTLTTPNQKDLLECGEVFKSLADWSRYSGIKASTLAQRMKKGWSLQKSMTEPLRAW